VPLSDVNASPSATAQSLAASAQQIPVIGYLDDVVIVPLGILAVVKMIPPEVMAESRAAGALMAERPVSRTAAVVIVFVWMASIALTGWLTYRYLARWN
jgi:hypothetical protein